MAIAHQTANNATQNNSLGKACSIALEAISKNFPIWQAVYATAAAGGVKALLESVQVNPQKDGSFTFKNVTYQTLAAVLEMVGKEQVLHTAIVVATIANLMDIDLRANQPKPMTTPIHEGKLLTLVTPVQDQQKSTSEGFDLQQQQNDGLKEGFSVYDGQQLNVFDAKIHVLYEKPGENGQPSYIGRTGGETESFSYEDIEKILERRDRNHHMNAKGFGDAVQIEISDNPDVIRGLEQLYIDANGGAQSMGGTSSNVINSISKTNPKREQYLEAAQKGEKDE